MLGSLARKNLLLDLNWFPQAGMRRVVIAAPLTEGLSATPHAAIRANSRSTVSTCSHSAIAARHTYVAVTGYVFDLTEWRHEKLWFELFRVMQLMPKTLNDQTDQTIRGSIRKKRPI